MVKQISVFIENTKGRLAEVTKTLADNKINIRAMSVADTKDFGILRLIVDDPDNAKKVLVDSDYTVMVKDVLAIAVPDEPGGLAKALTLLHESETVIEYMYAFIGTSKGRALVILKVADNEKVTKILEDGGVSVIDGKDLCTL